MTINNNYQGKLLISQPKVKGSFFDKTVIFIIRHKKQVGTLGILINKMAEHTHLRLKHVMGNSGVDLMTVPENILNTKLYIGGPIDINQVTVLHSDDWASHSTSNIISTLNVTDDSSILHELAEGIGPSKFRAACGICSWGPGQLEGEQNGKAPWKSEHRWLVIPATPELVFNYTGEQQWQHCVEKVLQEEIDNWFGSII